MAKTPSEPRLNTLFRIQTILILQKGEKSGYDLAKELEEITGTKPSTGKIYPFLKQLKDNGYIEEIDLEEDSERSKTVYNLTDKGDELVDEILHRMESLIDARLDSLLETCKSCGVRIYKTKVLGVDEKGNEAYYCCTHCRDNYYDQYHIHV
jgi:DNA-binding PadR family transcriptional regulator